MLIETLFPQNTKALDERNVVSEDSSQKQTGSAELRKRSGAQLTINISCLQEWWFWLDTLLEKQKSSDFSPERAQSLRQNTSE